VIPMKRNRASARLGTPHLDPTLPDIETYISAAEQHGQDSEPDNEVGDLQDLLRAAWTLLAPEQKKAFAKRADVLTVLEACL
jgi:hypothetical protein